VIKLGDPARQRKRYKSPKRPWEKARLEEEAQLKKSYGLKNKREIWKAKAIISRFRSFALKLGSETSKSKEEALLNKLFRLGLIEEEKATLDDVLALKVENILDRRLQTIVYKKGLARTPRQARQLIVHGHIAINGSKVTIPSYIVKIDEEDLITYYKHSAIASPDHPIHIKEEIKK
jgi:small subunit ribosomal protein S4